MMDSSCRATKKLIRTITAIGLASFLILLFSITSSNDVTMTQAQMLQANKNFSLSLQELFPKIEQSVVQVTARNETGISGIGSGFIYDNDSHIITSTSILGENNGSLRIIFSDGSVYRAQLIGADRFSDIAVLNILEVPKERIKPLPLGNSTRLKIGEQVATIGSPFGLSGLLTQGVVAKLGALYPIQGTSYSIPDTIVADLPINPGNSGGPLFNMKGEVMGITVGFFSQTSISFAVSSNIINKIVPSLITNGSYAYPSLGIAGTDITPEIADAIGLKEEARGYLLIDIVPGGPAAKAGMRGGSANLSTSIDGMEIALGGDVILAVDDTPVRKIDDILGFILREKIVGDNLKLNIFRDGRLQNIDVTLEARPKT